MQYSKTNKKMEKQEMRRNEGTKEKIKESETNGHERIIEALILYSDTQHTQQINLFVMSLNIQKIYLTVSTSFY